MGGECSAFGGEVHAGFCCGNLRERDQFEDPGVDGSIILGGSSGSVKIGAWTGSSFFRTGTGGGHV